MPPSTYSALRIAAQQIRNEHADNANTAIRVGDLLTSMIDTDAVALGAIDPCQSPYAAAGDGVTDDKAALLLAITAGIAAGKPVCGFGRTYGIAGNLTLVSNAWLQDISFKQLTPTGGTRRTLYSLNADNITLVNVTVDRNGDGTAGAHQVDAGVYIDGGSGHYLDDVEVFGDDIGVGLALDTVTDTDVVRSHVHDINYLLGADPGNDRVMGIYLTDCTRVRLIDCRAHDIGGDYGSGYTLRWSRGFGFARCENVEIHGCYTWMVDQGYDFTGGIPGNRRFLVADSFAIDCLTWGFKFANCAYEGRVDGCMAVRPGLSGFVANGPTGAGLTGYETRDITFSNCDTYDTGATGLPGAPVAGGKIAFRVLNGTFDIDSTVGIRFLGCKAIDTQSVRTMTTGFDNEIAAPTSGKYNECVDCVAIGMVGGVAFSNMNESRCYVSLTAPMSITTSGTWQEVDWDDDEDFGNMHDPATNNFNVTTRRAGKYRSTWGAVFAASATGQRGIRILREGVVIPGTTVLVNAASSGETALSTSWTSEMGPGDNLRIEVFQSSGGALNLETTSGGVVEQVG